LAARSKDVTNATVCGTAGFFQVQSSGDLVAEQLDHDIIVAGSA